MSTHKAQSALRSFKRVKAGKVSQNIVSNVSNVSTFAENQVRQGIDSADAMSAKASAFGAKPSATPVERL